MTFKARPRIRNITFTEKDSYYNDLLYFLSINPEKFSFYETRIKYRGKFYFTLYIQYNKDIYEKSLWYFIQRYMYLDDINFVEPFHHLNNVIEKISNV